MKHRAFIEGWSAGGATPSGAMRNAESDGSPHAAGMRTSRCECVEAGVIDLWSLHLQPHDAQADLSQVLDVLGEEDRRDAQRLRAGALRAAFLAGRRAQRCILSRYTGQAPQDLQVDRTGQGKPVLRHHSDVHFSFSRRGAQALLAVATMPVGVDLEVHRALWNEGELMAAIGCDAERRRIDALPASQQHAAVMRCWTAKEACVKAAGWGLALDPKSFDVGPLVMDAAAPSWTLSLPALKAGEPTSWSVRSIDCASGGWAALAASANASGARVAHKFWVA